MTAHIHRITKDNTDLLANIAEDVFDHAIDPVRLEHFLDSAGHVLFVAVDGGVVVGHIRGIVHLQPDRDADLYIDNLGVAPTHKRQGIATRLIRALVDWGGMHGCTYAWVATEPDNDEGVPKRSASRGRRWRGLKARSGTDF
jgi:ribosomal protein S18 acetylase RimI-like enzyme